ncbi:GIY-YIG nuclease family protein [Armatimonas sp.]|uniref:GIY-YIG nuclease family protein n=1 Tax=Armatimonas sp. TaxID=1872638 RepID=UPI00374DCF36
MTDFSIDELADELSDFAAPVKGTGRSAREERIVAGFEDIQRFVDTHGRMPLHGEERDIFERLYAVRLDRLRTLDDARSLLMPLDRQGLLKESPPSAAEASDLSLDDLAAELDGVQVINDIRVLKHVNSREDRRVAEEIANRTLCEDFEKFQPLFERVSDDLAAGARETRPFTSEGSINIGDFFVLGGQFTYVAAKGDEIQSSNGQTNARLRVVYSNGTESNLLLRSLQRALEKDEAGRRVVDVSVPNLFSSEWDADDISSGTIYVLRSLSSHPYIVEHRELIHKIGVTGGSVEARIAHASREATYLLADVEVVATYKLAAINRTKLEALFHRIFAPAQLDLTIQDRFGKPVRPKEWFLVPLSVIDETVQRISDGSITNFIYDPSSATLMEIK